MRASLWFWGLAGLQLYFFYPSNWVLLFIFVSSAVLARLLRYFVLDKWQHQVPTDGSWWVVITGTSSGFGQLGALRLASRGINVVATVRRESDGESLLKRAASDAIRRRIHVVLMDVASVASVKEARDQVAAKLQQGNGLLVGVINNAGYSVSGRLEAVPLGKWKKEYDVNVFGVVAVTQAFLPLLKSAAKQGASPRVVFVSSVVGSAAMAETAPYSSSKFAVQAIADNARVELRRYGIKTVVIQPGAFKTEFFGRLVKDFQLKDAEEGEELLDPAMVSEVHAEFEQKNEVLAKLALSFPPGDPVAEAMELSVLTKMPESKIFVGYDTGLYKLLSLAPDEIGDLLTWAIMTLPFGPFMRSIILGKGNKKDE